MPKAQTSSAATNLLAQRGTPPRKDPTSQLFRRAPTPGSTRSVTLPLSTNLHLAFDAHLLRTYAAWTGPGLNLFGPPYHGAKTPFIAKPDGQPLWVCPPFHPWSIDPPSTNLARTLPTGARFAGMSTRGQAVAVLYDVALKDGSMRVREQPSRRSLAGLEAVARRFELGASGQELWFLAHAENGTLDREQTSPPVQVLQRKGDFVVIAARGLAGLQWDISERDVDYWEDIVWDAATDKGWPRMRVQGRQAWAYLRIPAHENGANVEIITAVCKTRELAVKAAAELNALASTSLEPGGKSGAESGTSSAAVLLPDQDSPVPDGGDSFYRIEHFPLPREAHLQVTGMDFLPGGELALCTWLGEVYIVENATNAVEQARFRRFARGLDEPLGLTVHGGKIYVAQKCELTRLSDTNGDGEADDFETINDQWGYSGDYHAFAFGPAIDARGNFFVGFCGQRARWEFPFGGWMTRISAEGRKLEGFANGLRAPNGWGFFGPEQDLFVTDNEGNWIGACKLNHLQPGKYYGFPSASPAPREDLGRKKEFQPPAVWFPKKFAPSASGIAEIQDERFGPFRGQLLVGDFQNAHVMRVMLEQVNGQWQGVVWPFVKGFSSGVNRLAFGPDGRLYAGGLKNKAWPSLGPREASLDRVGFTGGTPFEIREVHARPDGFDLEFTAPVDRALAEDVENYDVKQFNFVHRPEYGSPEFDHEGRPNSSSTIQVVVVKVDGEGRRVRLVLAGLKPGFVTQVQCPELRSAQGEPLRQSLFYYTLNQIPAAAAAR